MLYCILHFTCRASARLLSSRLNSQKNILWICKSLVYSINSMKCKLHQVLNIYPVTIFDGRVELTQYCNVKLMIREISDIRHSSFAAVINIFRWLISSPM